MKVQHIKRKAAKASVSEKVQLAEKLRSLTPGAEEIIHRLELQER